MQEGPGRLFVSAAVLVLAVLACESNPVPTGTPPVLATATPRPPRPTPTPSPLPPQIISPQDMAGILARAEVPPLDRPERMARLGLIDRPVPRVASDPPPSYATGDVEHFVFVDPATCASRVIQAELSHVTDHALWWVEVGSPVDPIALAGAAERFEGLIYPVVHDYFGEEWCPGVDRDPRISILHLAGLSLGGAFGNTDEYTVEVWPSSNAREMFYVSLDGAAVGDDHYLSTLAHEFEHMVQWNTEGNEAHWLDEGLAQFAQVLVGLDHTVHTRFDFLRQSRVQLNAWVEPSVDDGQHYGAAYLFVLYLWERLGDDFIRALARHPGEGLNSVQATLGEQGFGLTVDALFADWIIANYLDDPALGDGRYGYRSETLAPICPRQRYRSLPVREVRSMPQFAADYIEIEGQGQIEIDFRGATEVALVPTVAHSGDSFWWSNRGDEAEMSLTRAFDLSGLEEATLRFWMWYDIQKNADEFACVAVSIDGGQTWVLPVGEQASYGPLYPCYSGVSGEGDEPRWVAEEMDLSPYSGREILVRFEYVTDTWFNGPGFVVDDIAIPELGYWHDAETGADGWEGLGFVRTGNAVPQSWALSWITSGDSGPVVERLNIAADGTAHAEAVLADEAGRATLVVGAMAPATQEQARYELEVTGDLSGGSVPRPLEPGTLFRDEFEDVCSGWGTYWDPQHVQPQYASGYADGAYAIEVSGPQSGWWVQAGWDLGDVMIEVDTTLEAPAVDNSWGVLCRYQDERNYYNFEVSNNGMYLISAVVNGEHVSLAGWAGSWAIAQGRGAANHLTVSCDGDLLSLSANGQLLAQVQDSTLAHGDVGLVVSTYGQGGARALFDNFVVREP